MYMNCVIKLKYYIKKESKKQGEKGICYYIVAGLTDTILCTITIIVLVVTKQVNQITFDRRLEFFKVASWQPQQ